VLEHVCRKQSRALENNFIEQICCMFLTSKYKGGWDLDLCTFGVLAYRKSLRSGNCRGKNRGWPQEKSEFGIPQQIRSKQSCPLHIFFQKNCLQRYFFHKKTLPTAHTFHREILCMRHLISVSSSVYRFIGIKNDSNSNTPSYWSQRYNL